jgi:hypothetical protein
MELKHEIVQDVLEDLIGRLDYDIYKYLKFGEDEEDRDRFPQMATDFVKAYHNQLYLNEWADELAKDCPSAECICKQDE